MFHLGEVMDKNKATNLSAVTLAFVGDAVYSLFVRERLTFTSDFKTGVLSNLAIKEVRATAQAEFVKKIEHLFTEEELNVYKRAKNAKKSTRSKSASIADYDMSTGFEAVLGYLYLTGNTKRLNYLLNEGEENESWR